MNDLERTTKADEAALAHNPEPKKGLPSVYWLTRDKHNGRLLDVVEVWLVKPRPRHFADGDLMWTAPLDVVDKQDTWHASMSLADAKLAVRTIPDSERECIRVGREAPVVVALSN